MNTRLISALMCGLLLSVATPALAQDSWFGGVGVGRLNTDFRPYYTYYSGGTPDQFENEAHGLQVEVMAGRRRQVSERFSLALQASASFNSFNWSLSIPSEPAELKYSLPYQLAVSVAPEVHFGRVSVYADLGGGMGRAEQVKTSPSSSTYDYNKMRATLNVGGGIRIKASGGASVYAHVGHVRYSGYEFDTFTPSKVRVEHVKDAPRATGITVGITKRF
jgi:hypothetical protein